MLPSSVIDMTIIASLSCFSAILSRPAAPGVQACFRALVTTSVMSRASGTARSGSRSEEHTSELQSLMRISYAVFCLKKKKIDHTQYDNYTYKKNKRQK